MCLTGTDLHRDLQNRNTPRARKLALASLRRATHLILLEPESAKRLPPRYRDRVTVIYQSAEPVANPPRPLRRCFEVSLAGHLRWEKDPFLAARAARKLPPHSRLKITHLGAALSESIRHRAEKETTDNPRYRWLGQRTHGETQRILARSQATLLTSIMEGAPSVLSEAVVNDVPVLATRIDAAIGLLGPDHPGLFPVGDANKLAELLTRCEFEEGFLTRLRAAGRKVKARFSRVTEMNSWRQLLRQLQTSFT